MSTNSVSKPLEPGDFDMYAFRPVILEGQTIEQCRRRRA
jgi:hypothetical protein